MMELVGRHRLQTGDIMDKKPLEKLMYPNMADFIYVDPPWGPGNLKYWYTILKRHTGLVCERPFNDTDNFLTSLFSIFNRYAKNIILMEYGTRYRDEIVTYAKRFNLYHNGIAHANYWSAKDLRPVDIHVLSKQTIISKTDMDNYTSQVAQTSGLDTILTGFHNFCPMSADTDSRGEQIVLDPCCGEGLVAEAAVRLGMTFRGNELNPKRLVKTRRRLVK